MRNKYLGRRIAKRSLACFMAVVLAFGMAACGSKDDEYDEEYDDEEYEDEEYEDEDYEIDEDELLEQLRKATGSAKLPGGEDELSQEIAMPLHDDVMIGYPKLMKAEVEKDTNTISFFSANRKGTFDEYADLRVMLVELDEKEQTYIDSLMEQGPGVAKHYMREIIEMYMRGTFSDYDMEQLEDEDVFADMKDSYVYAYPVAVWGDEWDDVPEDMFGCLYLRYVGSSGYLILGCSFAPEERADAYFDIAANIMINISHGTKWSTDSYAKAQALKAPVRERPDEPEAQEDDDGDEVPFDIQFTSYEKAYFWADSKDNCWFFDGVGDVFWSDGKHGSVDEETGAWTENEKFDWPELMYSDYLGDNADDDFSMDDDDEDEDYDHYGNSSYSDDFDDDAYDSEEDDDDWDEDDDFEDDEDDWDEDDWGDDGEDDWEDEDDDDWDEDDDW